MQPYRIVTREDSAPFEEKLLQLAAFCRDNGTTQELLVAMAAVIQQEATHHVSKHHLPHAWGVDNLMRAVEHTLRGDPSATSYVLEKLNQGAVSLNISLAAKPPVMA